MRPTVKGVREARPRQGPRERLQSQGGEKLSDAELLAVLLGTGTAREPVEVLATRILSEIGGLRGLAQHGAGRLAELSGLGPSKAARLVAALELGRRAAGPPVPRGARLSSSLRVYEALGPRLADLAQERFIVLALDAKHRCIAEIEVARGGLTACPVAPADVFRHLLREAAAAAILVHNHPSGDPAPSVDDQRITARLAQAGELLGVRVLDHVIVGREGYFSFLDMGMLTGLDAAAAGALDAG